MGDVVTFDAPTRLDIPVDRVLDGAKESGLSSVVVIGFREDGEFYFSSSQADAADVAWLCQRALYELNRTVDRMRGED